MSTVQQIERPAPKTASRRIMIVAGEASGDLHGANLVGEIRRRDPRCTLFGIAGEKMRHEGVNALINAEDIAGMGLTELASTIGRTLRALRTLRKVLRRDKPDLLILIDYAEFNMRLALIARRLGVPVLYYITPQVWAWRRGRIRKLLERADRLAVILPFEADLYAAAGERVTFVGHPLLDLVKPAQSRPATLARHGWPPGTKLLALLPGSRNREVRYLLPPMIEAAKVLASRHSLTPCVALASNLDERRLHIEGVDLSGIGIIRGDTYSIVAASELALVASGTATLETALLGCPMVIAYKVAPLTYLAARMLITGVDHIGMPNILAGKTIVPELIQTAVTASNLVNAAEPMLAEPLGSQTRAELANLRALLGAPGAASRVAEIALEMAG